MAGRRRDCSWISAESAENAGKGPTHGRTFRRIIAPPIDDTEIMLVLLEVPIPYQSSHPESLLHES